MRHAREECEQGSVTPMIIGFCVVLMMLVGVVVNASAAFLARQNLNSTADAAALAATDGMQGEQVYAGGLGKRAQIDPASARRYVADFLRSSDASKRYGQLSYEVTADRDRVMVRVRGQVKLPIPVPGVATHAMISGTAASEIAISD
ncbi:MAG: pilus assembly protein TadG-related protein [Nocardioidaceae bacterium]|nr:pilus assembly protein TadG-related protein [Marmoricola sp.]